MRTYIGAMPGPPRPAGLRLSRTRPRAFAEWQALRRWGKLPPWEEGVAGFLLRSLREGAALTQSAVAERLGVSQQAVAQSERWSANPTVALMRRWAEACGATLELRFERNDAGGPT
ncbi:MAG: helix-turn-helix transcriptional regulator [Acidobacteria bacterium]|nr:helix-turn-helix transcriptional regulator [Acidobacteriota bacterium]